MKTDKELIEEQRTLDALAACEKCYLDKAQKDTIIKKKDKEIDRKEGVIVKVIGERNECWDREKIKNEEIAAAKQMIADLRNTNAKLQQKAKPKRIAIGPMVGYGVSTGRPGIFAGIGITYALIRL